MLTLRSQHEQAMADLTIDLFAHRIWNLFRDFYPVHCRALGKQSIVAMARQTVERGARHGLVGDADLTFYACLMLLFGSDFDTDPACTWAATELAKIQNEGPSDPDLGAGRQLFDVGISHWKRESGEDNADLVSAILKLRTYDPLPLSLMPQDLWTDEFTKIYPRKAHKLGANVVAEGIDSACALCDRIGLSAPRDRFIVAIMRFVLGHGFVTDPLYGWIGEAIQHRTGIGEAPDLLPAARKHLNEWARALTAQRRQ